MSKLSLEAISPKTDLVCVIMAGGVGTRFWPASTTKRPKQFLALTGERSLLEQTYDRVASLVGPERIIVLTQSRFVDLVCEQLPDLPKENVVGEPMRRDTAAAVGLAGALVSHRFGQDCVMAVLTSDHVISPDDDFARALTSAAKGAKGSGALYTFGITPTFASTGFGYLQLGALLGNDDNCAHFELDCIVEKPDAQRAEAYLEGKKHLWNSGMFVWRCDAIMQEFERQLPQHFKELNVAGKAFGTPNFESAMAKAFEPLQRISVDYGIMEGAKDVRCVRGSFLWSDVGGFRALADHLPKDEQGNALNAALTALDAHDNLVFSEDKNDHIALLGVSGLVVVRAGNKTLVTTKERAEEIKTLVGILPKSEQ